MDKKKELEKEIKKLEIIFEKHIAMLEELKRSLRDK